jgi:hypothetical protein
MVGLYVTSAPFVPDILFQLFDNGKYMAVESLAQALGMSDEETCEKLGSYVVHKVHGSAASMYKYGFVWVPEVGEILRVVFEWTVESEITGAVWQLNNPTVAFEDAVEEEVVDVNVQQDDDDPVYKGTGAVSPLPRRSVRKRKRKLVTHATRDARLEELAAQVRVTRDAILSLRSDIMRSIQATKDDAMKAYVESNEFKQRLQQFIADRGNE